ncbi:MAG: IgA Peptidase M64 [Dysgonamonadaceae bacterium]|nr:IgA Peptidase M64 [Dysgonamonadaceae bacterium]
MAQGDFDTYFEHWSLRIDFALSGNEAEQMAALQQLRDEPVWGGPVKNLIDSFFYGGYYINVYDVDGGALLYSRGFNTLFEEWRTTEQAKQETQSWTNSISIPYPKRPIRWELQARDRATNRFATLWEMILDPQSIYIDRSPLKSLETDTLQYRGEAAEKVDLVFLPEGYTAAEMEKFASDARRFMEALFSTPPYDTRRDDFNVRAVRLPSDDSGTDVPGLGIFRQTALNSGFYTFGIDRYLTTKDMKAIRDAVWDVPCDAIFILVNSATYGGGGMYNFYAMGTADNEHTIRVFVHEFGHSFAGLADEYFQSEVAYDDFYNLRVEPWEPNITTLVDFDRKWKDMLRPGTPIPTPPGEEASTDGLGVFEGGGYAAKGIYRPADHCMMRDMAPLCPVCRRAILKMIDFVTDKHSSL